MKHSSLQNEPQEQRPETKGNLLNWFVSANASTTAEEVCSSDEIGLLQCRNWLCNFSAGPKSQSSGEKQAVQRGRELVETPRRMLVNRQLTAACIIFIAIGVHM